MTNVIVVTSAIEITNATHQLVLAGAIQKAIRIDVSSAQCRIIVACIIILTNTIDTSTTMCTIRIISVTSLPCGIEKRHNLHYSAINKTCVVGNMHYLANVTCVANERDRINASSQLVSTNKTLADNTMNVLF